MKKSKVEIYKLNGILNRDFILYSNSKYTVKEQCAKNALYNFG